MRQGKYTRRKMGPNRPVSPLFRSSPTFLHDVGPCTRVRRLSRAVPLGVSSASLRAVGRVGAPGKWGGLTHPDTPTPSPALSARVLRAAAHGQLQYGMRMVRGLLPLGAKVALEGGNRILSQPSGTPLPNLNGLCMSVCRYVCTPLESRGLNKNRRRIQNVGCGLLSKHHASF